MRTVTGTLILALALAGCAADGYDPGPDLAPGAVSAAKADGAFGAEELAVGGAARGSTGGDGLVLYALSLDEGDEIRVTVERAGGDLRPSAYLYRGTERFIAPDWYDAGPDRVSLDFTIREGGEHHIVVKAYRGEGAGAFDLRVECAGGTCAGVPNDPLLAQSRCIEAAARCALDDLPRWNGAVGATRARSIFEGCLADAGAHCATACDDAVGADVCGAIVEELPTFADRSDACLGVMTSCLDDCAGLGGYYSAYDLSETAASACWTGYNGNCLELVEGHASCGGSEYDAGSEGECRARCSATEGAWDEGPWDGCMEECDAIEAEVHDFIREVASEVASTSWPADVAALEATTDDALPTEVRDAVARWKSRWDEQSDRAGRPDDTAERADEAPYRIVRDGETVGYVIDMEYHIDDTLFDGGGAQLFFDVDGDLVHEEEWWG